MQDVGEASNLGLNYNESKYYFLEINKEIAKLAALTLRKQPKGIWTRVKQISLIPTYMSGVFFAHDDSMVCLMKKLIGKQQCVLEKMSSVDSVKEVAKHEFVKEKVEMRLKSISMLLPTNRCMSPRHNLEIK
ncbi:hypothetical protein EIN_402020 [Entamoeba invadens IP1]|uniref:Uncharacterized protein n=1 Tax=Entamoeba invadens IP1 TaxID=370355 RepID=L7FMC4_ENTIV|nr:hypothetical protein EIN_402020 [Entamoeba invadens IP1]ELP88644.1 hypothetical protein EIN_402020 [Entamoeba invadens IP1]|eukprot:XP_004255415.1 hypothetical protein EIN_402020 [Entamoeba invadens IP1]